MQMRATTSYCRVWSFTYPTTAHTWAQVKIWWRESSLTKSHFCWQVLCLNPNNCHFVICKKMKCRKLTVENAALRSNYSRFCFSNIAAEPFKYSRSLLCCLWADLCSSLLPPFSAILHGMESKQLWMVMMVFLGIVGFRRKAYVCNMLWSHIHTPKSDCHAEDRKTLENCNGLCVQCRLLFWATFHNTICNANVFIISFFFCQNTSWEKTGKIQIIKKIDNVNMSTVSAICYMLCFVI